MTGMDNDDNRVGRISALILMDRNGELSNQQRIELQEWMARSPSNRDWYEYMCSDENKVADFRTYQKAVSKKGAARLKVEQQLEERKGEGRSVDYLETKEFLHAFLNKDKKAFDALFEGYFERLYVFSFNLIGNEQEAEDIAIEVLTRLFRLSDQFRGLSNITAFLYISVRNRSLDYLRMVKRQTTKRQKEFYRLANEDPNLENTKIHGEQMKALYAAIEQLPEECRKVVELIYLEGLKYQEVAGRLGISINSVKTQRRIGLIKLQAILIGKNLMAFLAIPIAH